MLTPLLTVAMLSMAQPAARAEPTVVFVCEHGAAKSVIATAYFNKTAAERGLDARASYRGVNPQAALSAAALKGLRDDGLTVPDQNPSTITPADVERATVIFAIGCTLPKHAAASGKANTWDDVPDDKGYGATRDAIKRHIDRLVDDLLKKQRSQRRELLPSLMAGSPASPRHAGRLRASRGGPTKRTSALRPTHRGLAARSA